MNDSESAFRFDDAFRTRSRVNLAAFERRAIVDGGRRAAAVAMTFLGDGEGRACFVLTRRASTLREHARQWALPGGRVDDGEGPVAAALRELQEEVGLVLGEDSVLGILDDYATRSGFVITPIVVWAGDGAEPVANPVEVAELYRVPLTELERPDGPRFVTIPESAQPVIQVPIYSSLVHAPTAAVLYQTREVVLHGRSTRVAHYEQPVFAWK
jgi:8-oxo-dGTP pyrophosphatase MutT (NUDIX family)